jgi:hypothetical protein
LRQRAEFRDLGVSRRDAIRDREIVWIEHAGLGPETLENALGFQDEESAVRPFSE